MLIELPLPFYAPLYKKNLIVRGWNICGDKSSALTIIVNDCILARPQVLPE